MELVVDEKVKNHLAEIGYDPDYGARQLRRVIQTELETPLSQELIKEEFSAGDTIQVTLNAKSKELVFSKAK
jgi:ATP-dependent Clp protease ATP-binding subunit ClpA